MGRICSAKGINELAACVPNLIERYPDVKLKLAGIWEDEPLKTLVTSYPENVEYLGWLQGEDKILALRNSSIFVLPSYFEGQSVAILEAMASGCCVVASNVGGIPMMISNGLNGILVEPRNASSLEQGLIKVLDNTESCRTLGEKAQECVNREYDISETIDKLVKIYEQL